MSARNRTLVFLMAASLSASALASYENDDFSGQDEGGGGGFSDYARVEHVQPLVRQVRVSTPRRECWQEQVRYEERPGFFQANTGLILGGLAGGLLGGQIGHGQGRKIATIGGSILGAGVGYDYQYRHNPPQSRERVAYEDRCRTIEDSHTEERVEGYDVAYRYNGQLFHTRLPYDPGNRIRVGVDVRPLEP